MCLSVHTVMGVSYMFRAALKTEINSVLFSVIVYVQTLSLSDYQLTDLKDLNLDNIGKSHQCALTEYGVKSRSLSQSTDGFSHISKKCFQVYLNHKSYTDYNFAIWSLVFLYLNYELTAT